MVREVNSPHLKICLDAPLMPDKSAATMREAAQAVGSIAGDVALLAESSTAIPTAVITGVDRMMVSSLARRTNTIATSRGPCGRSTITVYTSYELCHQLPVVNGETVGIEFAHKNAQLARGVHHAPKSSRRNTLKSQPGKTSEELECCDALMHRS